ncbi:hypothetical protein [Hymenobacter cellulosilyticus]|uniref:Uncharacterized protein n=1 Tax=Hymenobacter cellulosilyticus TaxID=2932248 RepID=A0A8T9Q159_9BACT|nr:hypothetical protein [Hymenobacter cellulosilyticus]UOQ71127.1 hypothetical protein MUN79_21035 [Hymenobacter cellulosilyticus]
MAVFVSYGSLPAPAEFRARALHWAAQFAYCAYYEPNDLEYPQGAFERLLAVANGPQTAPASLPELEKWLTQPAPGPRCGFITYDVKNEVEALHSHHFDGLQWPSLHFFSPETWLCWGPDGVEIKGKTAGVLEAILTTKVPAEAPVQVAAMRPACPKPSIWRPWRLFGKTFLTGKSTS